MCVAIYKPQDAVIPKEDLAACFKANPDGAGFAVTFLSKKTQKPTLWWTKGFWDFDKFWAVWKDYETLNAVIHFRIATHGGITTDNCHPMITSSPEAEFATIHNGVLSGYSSAAQRGTKSDTRLFVENGLGPVLAHNPDWLDKPGRLAYLENLIGGGNKVVTLRNDGKVWIINERAGDWETYGDKKVWFSNRSWKWGRNCHKGVTLTPDDFEDMEGWAALCEANDTSGLPIPTKRGRFNDPRKKGDYWFSSGIEDAKAGVALDPDGGDNYYRGFKEQIDKMQDNLLFQEGYRTGQRQEPPKLEGFKGAEMALFLAGYHWAGWIRFLNATRDLEATALGDKLVIPAKAAPAKTLGPTE